MISVLAIQRPQETRHRNYSLIEYGICRIIIMIMMCCDNKIMFLVRNVEI
jgi:hypothetical protein